MTDSRTMQGLWIGANLPTMQRLSISSFLAHGHSYDLYVYEDLSGIPHGVRIKDANEILPASTVIRHAKYDTYATPFSDRFRYKLLLERGGWWVDTDVICLRPFAFNDEYVFSAEHQVLHGVVKEIPTITVMKAPSGSQFLEQLYDSCVALGAADLEWNESGSTLVRKLINQYSLNTFVQRAITFCPIPMSAYGSVLDPNLQFIFESGSYAAHLWHEFWRRYQVDIDATYDSDCLYEQLKAIFLQGSPPNERRPFIIEPSQDGPGR